MWFRKSKEKPSSRDVMRDLREQALTTTIDYIAGEGVSTIGLAMMEIGGPQATVSLVCVADGTTSMYFSSGGGIIGAGERATVRTASDQFRAVGKALLPLFVATDDHALPVAGHVRFFLRTTAGLLTADVEEAALSGKGSQLWPLYYAGHAVITAVREATPNA